MRISTATSSSIICFYRHVPRTLRQALGVLLLAAVVLSGCVTKPVVELHSARLTLPSKEGVSLEVTLQVNNENAFDVQVRNVNLMVVIADRFILPPVQQNPNQWLPSGSSSLVPVTIVVPWHMVVPLIAQTVGSEKITYRAQGTADVTAVRLLGIERNDYPVDEQGELRRADLVIAAAKGGVF